MHNAERVKYSFTIAYKSLYTKEPDIVRSREAASCGIGIRRDEVIYKHALIEENKYATDKK